MKRTEIRITGYGGQGVVLCGYVIGKACAVNAGHAARVAAGSGGHCDSSVGSAGAGIPLAAVVRGFPGLTNIGAEQLRANRVPTLALVGADDPLADDVSAMSELMMNVEVHRIEGADHMTAFGREEFAEQLAAFVAAHPRPAERPRAVGE